MSPATAPRSSATLRLLEIDASTGTMRLARTSDLPTFLRPGDVVVVNDAATLPASFLAHTASGERVEVRLVAVNEDEANEELDGRTVKVTAVLLGRGDRRVRTESRGSPPIVRVGEVLSFDGGLVGRVERVALFSERLLDIVLEGEDVDVIWARMYRSGRPVQYAHVPEALALWDVQNVWAGRPWAVEMPSAGRGLAAHTILALRARGVGVVAITHGAGLSSTGDPAIDARLPLPERFEVTVETARAIRRARASGGRVLAVGTSVVRALESAARSSRPGEIGPARGVTDLVLRPGDRRVVVDGLLTGVHEADTSHFSLLGAFAPRATLDEALARAEREGLLGHEFGDAWLVWGDRAVTAGVVGATFAA